MRTLPKTLKLNSYSDPGHGWIKVKRSLLQSLGIADKITRYSFQRGQWVYLEEDCDASTFMDACKAMGIEVSFSHKCGNRQSRIRQYDRYCFDLIDAAYKNLIIVRVS